MMNITGPDDTYISFLFFLKKKFNYMINKIISVVHGIDLIQTSVHHLKCLPLIYIYGGDT